MPKNYPEFDYPASMLSAFLLSMDTFIISLKDGKVVHFTPRDTAAFEAWLTKHHIRNINKDKGFKNYPI